MKSLRKISALLLATAVSVLTISQTAYASTETYVTGDDNYRQPVPESYVVTKTVNNLGGFVSDAKKNYFKNPQDMFVDNQDNIYVVDTGNNRIVKLNSDFKTVAVFEGPDKKFKNPQGIFVDEDGDMFVSDTDNHRIVHMDPEGKFVEEFNNPESSLKTGDVFTPSKLIVSQTGYIYVVRGENIMAIDGNGEFRGYYGQTNIGYNLTEVLMRMFASEDQQKFIKKRLASSFINLDLGSDGMIYATSMEREEGELKKLNSVGTNIYRKYKTVGNSINNPITTFINNKILATAIAGNSFRFGEYFDDDHNFIQPIFTDICVDNDGVVTVIEQLNGKVYQYDQDGNMLVAFGGLGEQKGTFTRASAIDVTSDGTILVLDQINCSIQAFEPTEFIGYVHEAVGAYNAGDYQKSYEIWNKVLSIDENYDLAHVGIAKAYYKQGQYKKAMDESKIVSDRDVYTMAFDEYKYEVLRANFAKIVLIALLIIAAIIILLKIFVKHAKVAYWKFIEDKNSKMGLGQGLLFAYYSILHPFDALEAVKYKKEKINMAVPFILLATAYIVRMAYLFVVHFPLASIEVADINPLFEAVKLFLFPLVWIPASFMATSISGGESKSREIFFVSGMSMVPFIIINAPLMFLSNLMSKSQKSWYGVFGSVAILGMFLILFLGLMVLNNYSFGKTVGMTFVTAFLILVVLLVALIVYILSGRMIQFVISIMNEFRLNFL